MVAARRSAAPVSSVVEELVEELQRRIVSGATPTGSWLRQERLAHELGVSRTPVREALRSLEARGLVTVHPHRGALVSGPSARDLREAYAVRAELEAFAAELAAGWIDDRGIARLSEAEAAFERLVDSATAGRVRRRSRMPRWQQANDLFHEAVLDAAGNARLHELVHTLHQRIPRSLTWMALSGDAALLRENVAQHRRILTAVVARDRMAARAAMREHVTRAGQLVVRHFEHHQDPDVH